MSEYAELSGNNSNNNATCVVCYKNVKIYSIGMCDHPVCYECSTRMRVLCQQNECPICRQDLPKVVFTRTIKTFRHLKKGNLLDTKYNIYFESPDIQDLFNQLLAHVCTICKDKQVFNNFNGLKDHMRRKHEQHYCDLCVENLKIFSYERRSYSRADLAQHRRKGDKDDKSHKGHPLCEFCDRRYMDNDELFRHLRRDHLYCHFCDADGLHQYYSSYDYLREHFRQEHYLCEEGPCIEEKFTCVFRTDIDLRAHKASKHGKHLGKAAAKQARTLELEFTLAPRGDNRNGGRRPQSNHSGAGPSNTRSQSNNDYGGGINSRDYHHHHHHHHHHQQQQQQQQQQEIANAFSFEPDYNLMKQPDVKSTEEFPSLGNSAPPPVPSLNVTNTKGRGNLTIRGSLKPQILAVTDENFPALSLDSAENPCGISKTLNFSLYSSNKSTLQGQQRPQSATSNVSIHVNHKTDGSITTRVSGPNIRIRPSQLSMDSEFPALGRGESSSGNSSNSGQWTKVTCVKSAATTMTNAKGKKLAPTSLSAATPPGSPTPPQSFSDAFPSLPKTTKSKKQSSIAIAPNTYSSTWNQSTTVIDHNDQSAIIDSSKVNSKKKKKKKVKQISSGNNSSGNESTTSKSNSTMITKVQSNDDELRGHTLKNKGKIEREFLGNNSKQSESQNVDNNDCASLNNVSMASSINNSTEILKKRSELKINNVNGATNDSKNDDDYPALRKLLSKAPNKLNPPPGFNVVTPPPPPPPGFAVKLNRGNSNCIDNGLTFTSSSGESYSILPDRQNRIYNYVSPPDFQKRNKALVEKIGEVLGLQESIEEFRFLSGLFRQGACSADDYYNRCRSAMGISAFSSVFPEMLVLLPDITKQRELFELHKKDVGHVKIKSLEMCSTCGQIVKTGEDLKAHNSNHSLENHFPTLGEAAGIQSPNN